MAQREFAVYPQHSEVTGSHVTSPTDYLTRLARVAGRPPTEFTGINAEATIGAVKEALGFLDGFTVLQVDHKRQWNEWVATGGVGPGPEVPVMPEEEKEAIGRFIPSYTIDTQALPEEEAIAVKRRLAEESAAFWQAAAGLENTEARYAHEPGSHAPVLLPAIDTWYREFQQGEPTSHLMIGALSRRSGLSVAQMVRAVDPEAELHVIDLDPLSPPPDDGPGAFTFSQANALALGEEFRRGSFDAIHAHLLLLGASQLQSQQQGADAFYPIPEHTKARVVPQILGAMRRLLRPGGALFLMERIDANDHAAVERLTNMMVMGGFRREDVLIAPALMFATRQDTDAFFAGTSKDVTGYIASQKGSGHAVAVPEDGYSIVVAVKPKRSLTERLRATPMVIGEKLTALRALALEIAGQQPAAQ